MQCSIFDILHHNQKCLTVLLESFATICLDCNCSTNLKTAQLYKMSLSSNYLWSIQIMKSLPNWWLKPENCHNVIHFIKTFIPCICNLLMDIWTLYIILLYSYFQLQKNPLSNTLIEHSSSLHWLVGELKLYGVLENYRDLPLSEALQLHISKAVCSKQFGLTGFDWIISKSIYIWWSSQYCRSKYNTSKRAVTLVIGFK